VVASNSSDGHSVVNCSISLLNCVQSAHAHNSEQCWQRINLQWGLEQSTLAEVALKKLHVADFNIRLLRIPTYIGIYILLLLLCCVHRQHEDQSERCTIVGLYTYIYIVVYCEYLFVTAPQASVRK
jgi:hypothetical protein